MMPWKSLTLMWLIILSQSKNLCEFLLLLLNPNTTCLSSSTAHRRNANMIFPRKQQQCVVFFFMQLLSVDCACWTWDWELRKLVSKSDNNKILYFKLLPSLARLTLHIFLAPDETTTRSTQHHETSYERKIFARPQTTRESALLRADLRCSFFGDDQKCRKESIDRRARRRGGRQRRAI